MWGNQGGADTGYGDQGGGFINSPANFGSSQSQEKKTRMRLQNILPCTVAQIFGADQQDDVFITDGIEIHQVTIVGLVQSLKETATRLDYEIDDTTGPPLEVRQFVDNDENTPTEERTIPLRENTYVRVYGHVRSFNGKRNVVAFRITPITDPNEITTHMLEAIHSRLYMNNKLKGKVAAGPSVASTSKGPGAIDNSYSGAMPDQGLNSTQNQVLAIIRSAMDEQGIGMKQICERVRTVPPGAIRDALEFLSSEGHIYSTIDDEHYKSTDS